MFGSPGVKPKFAFSFVDGSTVFFMHPSQSHVLLLIFTFLHLFCFLVSSHFFWDRYSFQCQFCLGYNHTAQECPSLLKQVSLQSLTQTIQFIGSSLLFNSASPMKLPDCQLLLPQILVNPYLKERWQKNL